MLPEMPAINVTPRRPLPTRYRFSATTGAAEEVLSKRARTVHVTTPKRPAIVAFLCLVATLLG